MMAPACTTAVLYDLDSTVRDTRHRHHLSPVADPSSTWKLYALACEDDPPIRGTVARMRLDWPHHQVHLVSGADPVSESMTRAWLGQHVGPYWDALHLRYGGSVEDNAQVKAAYVAELHAAGIDVVLAYEDRPEVGLRLTELTSVPVVTINPCYDLTCQESTLMRAAALQAR